LRNTVLGYAIREVQENQEGMELSGKHQFLVYDCDVNTVSENTNSKQRNNDALLQADRDVGPEANTEKIRHVVTFRHQNA
jgi:hypothetical protein